MKFSLISTSQGGREKLIVRLLESLKYQSYNTVELIFIDQTNNEYESLIKNYSDFVEIIYICINKKVGLSYARNIGLMEVTGEYVGFCDDDAFYDEKFFFHLNDIFVNKKYSAIVLPVIDKKSGRYYANRGFPKRDRTLDFNGIVRFALSVGVFVEVDCIRRYRISFDEELGAGAKFGGSEETDFFLSLLVKSGCKFSYLNSLFVYHDNDCIHANSLPEKYYNYAIGYGLVIKRYMKESNYTLLCEVGRIIFRSLVGSMLYSKKRSLYLSRVKGVFRGLIKGV